MWVAPASSGSGTPRANGNLATKEHVKPGNEGIGPLAGDTLHAMYELDNGASAYFASRRNAAGNRFGLQIFGSQGVIEILTGHLPAVYILQPMWSPGRSGKSWVPVSSAGIGKESRTATADCTAATSWLAWT